MADNSEEFDFAAASKAEIDKAKQDQKKQKEIFDNCLECDIVTIEGINV